MWSVRRTGSPSTGPRSRRHPASLANTCRIWANELDGAWGSWAAWSEACLMLCPLQLPRSFPAGFRGSGAVPHSTGSFHPCQVGSSRPQPARRPLRARQLLARSPGACSTSSPSAGGAKVRAASWPQGCGSPSSLSGELGVLLPRRGKRHKDRFLLAH